MVRRLFFRHCAWGMVAAWVAGGGVVSALAGEEATRKSPRQLVIGIYPSELPSEELEKIDPIRRGLEKRLAAAGIPVTIDIQIFRDYDDAVQEVVAGKVDVARMGPANYVLAKRQNPGLKLLGMETQNRSKELTGYVFVHASSRVRKLGDLRGRRMAFGSPGSTTGCYFPQAALVDAGIFARDLAGYRYLGRHDKVFQVVGSSGFDAGTSNEVTFSKYGLNNNFRVIHVMKSPAHAWLGRAGMPDDLADHLRDALCGLGADELTQLSRDGIVKASDADFERVRQAMQKAERFSN